MDWTEPNVCISENLFTDDDHRLRLNTWSAPRLVADVIARSGGDGALFPFTALPGKLLIDKQLSWVNDAPIDQMLLIRVTRGPRSWITSNPNAIQFRDRWTHNVSPTRLPEVPVTTSLSNGQLGSAIDLGTNTVAEPNPGVQWVWWGTASSDEWVGPLAAGERFNMWYRCYVWTPPPFSDNANKNAPKHEAYARWTRIQLIAFPQQGQLVQG